mmetsp:Transcript_35276/g.49123  ORF Transcript_35276/g.49123 Transcript_35276/m.49123 type:complete len:108 (-) Transcript_35276:888-1211(-)
MTHSPYTSLESIRFEKQAILWILRSHRESIIKQIHDATVTTTEGKEINLLKSNNDFVVIGESSLPFVSIILKIDLLQLFQRDLQFASHLLKKFNTSHHLAFNLRPIS